MHIQKKDKNFQNIDILYHVQAQYKGLRAPYKIAM